MHSMVRRLKGLFVLLILLLLGLSWLYFLPRTGASATPVAVNESGGYTLLFCQQEDCRQPLLAAINASTDVKCAFYDLTDPATVALLKEKRADVLVYGANYDGYGTPINATAGGLMHDKICVLDNRTVITGSTNPTVNCYEKNDNNLLIIDGAALAQDYLVDIQGIKDGAQQATPYPLIDHTAANVTFRIETYFCPADNCEEHLLDALGAANSTIDFMTFSFTSDPIGKELVNLSAHGVAVRGVFERREESQYSEYARLKDAGLDVRLDGNSATMHHKVFIIDDETVAFGSYNPTASGNTKNDENLLIVHDKAIAEAFEQEFRRVYADASP